MSGFGDQMKISSIISMLLGMWTLFSSLCFAQSPSLHEQRYQQALDTYRTDYSNYEVKKSEFDQFKTYTAEDELIKTARQMLIARAEVWTQYWQLLRENILSLEQPTTEIKNEWSTPINKEVEFLQNHQISLESLDNREELLKEARKLNEKAESYLTLANKTNALFVISRLSYANNSLLTLNQGLTERINSQQILTNEKDLKLRGLQTGRQRINDIATKIKMAQQELLDDSANTSFDIASSTSPIYADVSQQYQIIRELSTGVEW